MPAQPIRQKVLDENSHFDTLVLSLRGEEEPDFSALKFLSLAMARASLRFERCVVWRYAARSCGTEPGRRLAADHQELRVSRAG